jgi:hypothetical protein
MYTLVDFVTHIKGVEYILSILAIGGFLLLWEILKPAPFRTLVETGKDDLGHIEQSGGFKNIMKSVGKIAAAPFIGLAYLAMLPVGFSAAVVIGGTNVMLKGFNSILGRNMSLGWRPMEAYFAGRKRRKNGDKNSK